MINRCATFVSLSATSWKLALSFVRLGQIPRFFNFFYSFRTPQTNQRFLFSKMSPPFENVFPRIFVSQFSVTFFMQDRDYRTHNHTIKNLCRGYTHTHFFVIYFFGYRFSVYIYALTQTRK
jgi:hypothetical protein